jgi:hypothetical protein
MSKNRVFSLWIISPSGGLIYKRVWFFFFFRVINFWQDFIQSVEAQKQDDALRLGSFFHSQYAISAELSPFANSTSGMELIETDDFKLQCLRSPTGLHIFF